MQQYFIDECFVLTNKRVDKSLGRIRKIGDNTDLDRTDIRYDFVEGDEDSFVLVTVAGYPQQRIAIDPFESYFGERNYFKCPGCDARCCKLFLLPRGHIFLCKSCHKLKYETFNPSSVQGRLFLRTKKILKLIKVQEDMTPRIFYKSKYTKRYLKFLKDCLKVGLVDIVKEAQELEALIQANSGKTERTL
jgi:hypothetical protein